MIPTDQNRAPGDSASRIRGFTIVELLVAMVIAGLVLASIYAVFTSSNRSYHTQDRVVDTQQGLRVGVDFMVRDIRMAGLDPEDTGLFTIEQAAGNLIQFVSDLNMDGIVDEDFRERIFYQFAGGELRRCNIRDGVTFFQFVSNASPPPDRIADQAQCDSLIEGVNALTFQYLDASGQDLLTLHGDPIPALNLIEIRTVVITMQTQGTDAEGGTFDRTLSTRVICRNL